MNKKMSCKATLYFQLPVGETCQWPGTKWEGEGIKARVLPCGEPAVGKGEFHEYTHRLCAALDLCERHANRQTEDISQPPTEKSQVWGSLYG